MRLRPYLYLLPALAGAASATSFKPASVAASSRLAAAALREQTSYASTVRKNESCQDPIVRKEWSDLTVAERKEWVAAVNCLMDLPPRSSSMAAPGARSRYDDFLATHINQTMTIHYTANFLHWHRYFLWTFEQTLREECGYKGYQPYADWGKYVHNPIDSPIFDGSESSIGSNGLFSPRNTVITIPSWAKPEEPHLDIPLNILGGGCIEKGPFANRTVNLGPADPTTTDPIPNPRPDGLGYNPRCLKRELSSFIAEKSIADTNATDLINNSKDIGRFQDTMGRADTAFGVHTGGHALINASPGANLYTSPGDPEFWLHHGYIDRLWWIWQNTGDPEARRWQIDGTRTFQNNPPSSKGELGDLMDLGVNGEARTLRSVTSTLEDGFCYVYG